MILLKFIIIIIIIIIINADKGSYKQFVTNRVNQINAKDYIEWRHVSTDQNPAV